MIERQGRDAVSAIDFHFDLMCPYAYQTSLWIREVRARTGLVVNWRFFSLEEINRAEGKKHPWEREWSYGWSMMRIGALLRRQGPELLDAWYATAGRALHVDGEKPHRPEVARDLLARMGLDPGLVDAAIADPTTGDEVLAEHRRVTAAGGFGVPTLFFPDGQCIFGPVLIDPPAGEEAERLWDLVRGWTLFPHLYEIQRPKSRADVEQIAAAFGPYLQARDWVSINRGTVVDFPAPPGSGIAASGEGGPMTEPDSAGAGGRPPGTPRGRAEQERLIGVLEREWQAIGDLLAGLSAEDWAKEALPGWSVHDTVAHMIGTERMLAGAEFPPAPGEDQLGEHVRNDIGRANEAWVASLRDRADSDLLDDFRAVTAGRLAALRAMSPEEFNAPSWTPAGQATFARFMQIRVFDCWMHEQDIRAAVGRPGNEGGEAAVQSLDEVVQALGYIVGKRGRAPDGSSVLIRLRGPVERDLAVVVDGRARVVSALETEPTATLTLSSAEFMRLAGGREDAEAALARIELDGDVALARQLATNLAYTI